MRRFALSLPCWLACVWACSSASSSHQPVPDDAATSADASVGDAGRALSARDTDTFCDDTYAKFKTYLATCCTPDDIVTEEYALVASVFDTIGEGCKATLGRSAEKARIAIEAEAATRCKDAFAPLATKKGCSDGLGEAKVGELCRPAIVGLQREGDACALDYECADGLWCKGPTTNEDGTCAKPAALGEDCATTGAATTTRVRSFGDHPHCQEGAYCPTSAKRCTKLKASGTTCTENGECAGGACYLGKCDTKTAQPAGSDCLKDSDCGRRLYCKLPTSGGGLGSCTANRVAPEACSNTEECLGRCATDDAGANKCVPFCGAG